MTKRQTNPSIVPMTQPPIAGFRIERMEDIYDRGKGRGEAPHRHEFYTVLLVEAGEGSHLIDFQSYPITDRVLFFVSPGQVHQVFTPVRPIGWAITFTRDFLEQHHIYQQIFTQIRLFRRYNDNPPLEIEEGLVAKLSALCQEMESMMRGSFQQKSQGLGALLQLFLIYCNNVCTLQQVSTGTADTTSRILLEFRELVEKNYATWHKVKEYAEALHITPKYLNEVVKNHIGYTAKEYIQERLTTEAKRLLVHSPLSVKEIAFQLGFDDPLHFSGFFKNCTHISPTDFRSQAGQQVAAPTPEGE